MASLKASRPDLRIIVTGSAWRGNHFEAMLQGQGYVDESRIADRVCAAIRIVNQGSLAPRACSPCSSNE